MRFLIPRLILNKKTYFHDVKTEFITKKIVFTREDLSSYREINILTKAMDIYIYI